MQLSGYGTHPQQNVGVMELNFNCSEQFTSFNDSSIELIERYF